MREDIEDIGDLFKDRLDEDTMEPKSSNWDTIQKDLNKIQFRRFSIFRFNIYYASLIVIILLFSSYYMFRSFSSEKEVQKNENNAIRKTDSITSIDNKEIKNHNNASGLSSDKSTVKNILKSANTNAKKTYAPSNGKSDTTNTLNTTAPLIQKELLIETIKKPEPEKIKPKQERKQIYLTKQDTLVVIDTLDDAAPRKRLKKGKTNVK